MKQHLFALLIAIALILSLGGCAALEPETEAVVWRPTGTLAPETTAPEPSAEPEPPAYETDGFEYALFPMEYLQITQTSHEGSHLYNWAVDLGGRDRGVDEFFAPFTLRIVRIQEGYNIVWAQSIDKVHLANGGLDYVSLLLEHADSIDGLYVGQVVPQGQVFYTEGMAGNATGNHVHAEFGLGRYVDEGCYHAEDGRVACNNGIAANEILFLTDSTQIVEQEDGGFTWNRLPGTTQELVETGYLCQGQGHLPDDLRTIAKPTCTTDGSYRYTCQLCGQAYTGSIPATGHTAEEIRRIEPGADTCGAAFYQCQSCGEGWLELLWASAPDCPFADVTPSDAPYVAAACELGYLEKFDDSSFLPDGYVARAELLSILYELGGQAGFDCDYSDVWDDDDDYSAIAWATQTGMAEFTEGRRFAPTAAVTREDALRMVLTYMQQRDIATPLIEAEEPAAWAVAAGLFPASADLHCPLTRAECARLLTMMALLPDVS